MCRRCVYKASDINLCSLFCRSFWGVATFFTLRHRLRPNHDVVREAKSLHNIALSCYVPVPSMLDSGDSEVLTPSRLGGNETLRAGFPGMVQVALHLLLQNTYILTTANKNNNKTLYYLFSDVTEHRTLQPISIQISFV